MRLAFLAAAATLTATALFAALPARAERLFFSKITCEDFNKADPQSNGKLLFWLSGYYMGNDDDPIIDFDKLGTQAKGMIQYCHDNPKAKLSDAAETIMGAKSK